MRGGIKADCRHMHQISDGERRRVQLCMGLMTEWDVLLLDEVRYTPLQRAGGTLISGYRRSRCSSSIRPY